LIWWVWAVSRPKPSSEDEYEEEYEDDEHRGYLPRRDLLWALTGIMAVLTSVHLNPHDLTLLVFPAWILGAYATSGLWNKGLSRLWIALLTTGYLLAPLTLTNPTSVVIPSVMLMATACGLLALQLAGNRVQLAVASP